MPSNPYIDMQLASHTSCYGSWDVNCNCPLYKSCKRFSNFSPFQMQPAPSVPVMPPKVEQNIPLKSIRAVTKGVCAVCQKPYQVGDRVILVPQVGPKHMGC